MLQQILCLDCAVGQIMIFLDKNRSRHKMVQKAVKAGICQRKTSLRQNFSPKLCAQVPENSPKSLFETGKVSASDNI